MRLQNNRVEKLTESGLLEGTVILPKPLDAGYLYHVLKESLNQADREKDQNN